MAKPLKIFLIVFGILVVLIAGAAIAAVALFDANELKGKISAAAKENTGRELTIAGDIDLSLFPWLGVSMSEVTLANAKGFGPEPFVHLKAMDVRVKLLPLLIERSVHIGKVTVHGLAVNLARNEQGVSNWDDLVDSDEDPGADSGDETKQGPNVVTGSDAQGVVALAIGGLDIRDVAVSMVDLQAGTATKVEKLNLETGPVTLEDPIELALSFVATTGKPQVTTDVKLTTIAAHDTDNGVYEARNLALDVVSIGETIPDGKQSVKLTANARYDEKAQVAELSDLVVNAMGSTLRSNVRFDIKADTLDLADTVLEAYGAKMDAAIKGTAVTGDAPNFTGRLSSKPFNPRELAKKFETDLPPMADATALTLASFSSDFSSDLKSARLDNLNFKLDQSTATGHLHVTDIATQSVVFALKMDRIDADRYLAPPAADEGKKGDAADDFRKTELPIAALDQVNAKGTITIGELTLKKSKLNDVVLNLDAPKGKVKTQTLTAKLFGGTLMQNAKITPGEKPTYSMVAGLNQIEAGPLLQAFTGKKYLTGLGDLQFNIASGGATVGDALKGLNGNVSSSLVKGAIEGFNMKHKVDQARALFNKEQAPAESSKRTEFSDVAGAGEIKNGVLTTKTLKASGTDYKLTGDGNIDLAGLTIDYVLMPTYTGGANLKGLGGLAVPLRVTGNLFSPTVKVDVAGALKGKAREAVTEARESVKEEVSKQKEKVKEKAIQRLGDFFAPKKKKDPPAEAPAEAPADTAE